MSRLLTQEICDRLEAVLISKGLPVLDSLNPGLSDEQIDAIVAPTSLLLPEEVRVWWRWRNGSFHRPGGRSEIFPDRELLTLEESVDRWSDLADIDHYKARLVLLSERSVVTVRCVSEGDVAAPVDRAHDHSCQFEQVRDSLGELVLTWISYLENDVFLRETDGRWMNPQPVGRIPEQVQSLAVC